MDLPFLPLLWQDLAAHLAACLHQRHAWRLTVLLLGALFAKGRRTVTSWLRAAHVGPGFAAFYYFLAALGCRTDCLAGLLLRSALSWLAPDGPLLFAIDDSPTKRYGRHVQGAGLHHNPTPGADGPKVPLWPRLGHPGLDRRSSLVGRPGLAAARSALRSAEGRPPCPPATGLVVSHQAGTGRRPGPLGGRWGPLYGPGRARRGGRLLRQATLPQGGRGGRGHRHQSAAPRRRPAHVAGAAAGRPTTGTAAGVRVGPYQLGQACRAQAGLAGGAHRQYQQVRDKRVKTFLATWRPVGGVSGWCWSRRITAGWPCSAPRRR